MITYSDWVVSGWLHVVSAAESLLREGLRLLMSRRRHCQGKFVWRGAMSERRRSDGKRHLRRTDSSRGGHDRRELEVLLVISDRITRSDAAHRVVQVLRAQRKVPRARWLSTVSNGGLIQRQPARPRFAHIIIQLGEVDVDRFVYGDSGAGAAGLSEDTLAATSLILVVRVGDVEYHLPLARLRGNQVGEGALIHIGRDP